jgi:pimeloyl-ACP methyl ester carboxylesterase
MARIGPLRELMLRTSIGLPERAPAATGRAMIAAWIDAPGYEAANAEMRRHVCEDLDRVTVPTTIVWGELDRLVAPPRPERRPPGSRYLQFERLGHTPNWDDPDLVARLLLEASAPVAA